MSTIKDVAEHCGVSIATVSAVINEAKWVSSATREKVTRSIEALRYRPNHLARSLKSRRSGTLGILVSDLSESLYIEIVRAVEQVVREGGLNLFVCDSDCEPSNGRTNFHMLLEKQADGLILIGPAVEAEVVEEHLRANNATPVVAVDFDRPVTGLTRLVVDYERAGYDATMHLVQQGYRGIAFIGRSTSDARTVRSEESELLAGYRRALVEAGQVAPDEYVAEGNRDFESGMRAAETLLSLQNRPSAIFATHDLIALGAMRRVHELGITVPAKLGIVGCGDMVAASAVMPSLTTLQVPKASLGRDSGGMLLDFISGETLWTASTRFYGARIVPRESSARRA